MAQAAYTPKWAKYFILPQNVDAHWVRGHVKKIRKLAEMGGSQDFETAHIMEDELHQLVLWAIARGRYKILVGAARMLCREALRTQTIAFSRVTS